MSRLYSHLPLTWVASKVLWNWQWTTKNICHWESRPQPPTSSMIIKSATATSLYVWNNIPTCVSQRIIGTWEYWMWYGVIVFLHWLCLVTSQHYGHLLNFMMYGNVECRLLPQKVVSRSQPYCHDWARLLTLSSAASRINKPKWPVHYCEIYSHFSIQST